MEQSNVAGTVILNKKNGHKKFLVKKESEHVEFIQAPIDTQYTSLACILNELSKTANLDLSSMELVELTNINVREENIPLFVFSLDEDKISDKPINNNLKWEEPAILREVLQLFKVSGVPFFK